MSTAEEKWQALVEHWPGHVVTIDADDRLTLLNRSSRMIDAARDLGRNLFEFIQPNEQADIRANLAAARAGAGALVRRLQTRLPDGSSRWYDSRFIRLPDGGVMIVSSDVTDEQDARLALSRSEQRHRALVENSHDALALTGADGTTLYASPVAEQISGYPATQYVGALPFANVHPDDRERVLTTFTRIRAQDGASATFEFRSRHRDGSYRWIEATATNRLGDPNVAAIVSNFRDVTARRELAEERRRARDAEHSVRRLRVLSNATQAFSDAGLSSDRLFDTVTREIAETLQCACALTLISDDQQYFTTPYSHAPDRMFLDAFRAYLAAGEARPIAAHPGLKHIVATRTPFYMPHVANDEHGPVQASMSPALLQQARAMQVKSALVVPLIVRGVAIGALCLSTHGDNARALDEHDLSLAQSLAEHAALALAASRLLEESEQRLSEREAMATRLRLLADASCEFSEASTDDVRLTSVIARRLSEVIGDLCSIRTLSEDGTTLERGAVHHRDPEVVALARDAQEAQPTRIEDSASWRRLVSGQPLFAPKMATAALAALFPPQYRAAIEHIGAGSMIVAPMQCSEKVIGIVTLLRSGNDNPYDESDLHLVRNLADHAALAIANARSYAAERSARAAAVNANETLRKSEIAHRLLFDSSPIPLLVFDVETLDLVAVNDAALTLYRYEQREMLQLKLSDLRGEDDRHTVKPTVDSLGETQASGTVRHVRKDGSSFFAEYTSRPLLLSGRPARITVITDVTDRHEAEQARALLASIVRSSNDAIVSKRLDGVISSWNHAAERLFGYSAGEAIGQPITLVVPHDRRDEELALLSKIARGERIENYETTRRCKDGSEVAVAISLAPIFDGAGNVIGASKAARDLSAQRRAETTLRRTEEQLRQAQKMEAIGRLAGGIAHDFNNLLSVILSYGELIDAELKEGDPIRADMEEIQKAAVRAADLTRQLLMFSRQQVVAPKVLDLNEVLGSVDRMLRRIVGEDIELTCVRGREIGRILADPSNVEQVIMNLVVNARDAMPTGGKLTIETANIELDDAYAREHLGAKTGRHVMLAVSDTGVGMNEQTQARIFEPFFTTKESGKGTGLGLSTVFGIVQQSGGSVWVYSEIGAGTTFKIYLPRVEADAETTAAMPALRQGGFETILLVEDQEQVRTVAHNILKRSGYRVLPARDVREALQLCAAHDGEIDLLLTDVVMPGMSGAELAKLITTSRRDVKVLYMSGYTDDSIVRHGVLESEMAFLQKPFTRDSLTRKVREVLDGPRARSA